MAHRFVLLFFAPLLCAAVFLAVATSGWQEVLRRVVVLHLRDAWGRDIGLEAVTLTRDGRLHLIGFSIGPAPGEADPLFTARAVDVYFDPVRLRAEPRRPLSSVRRVVLDRPSVSLARYADGGWNFDDLLVPRDEPSADPFQGEVEVRNGDVRFRNAGGLWEGEPATDTRLVQVNARFMIDAGGTLPFHATFSTADGLLRAATLTGSLHRPSRRFLGTLRFADLDLAAALPLLPAALPLAVDAGRVDGRCQVMLSTDPHTGKPLWNATVLADLRDVRGTLAWEAREAPYHLYAGQVRLSRHAVELIGLRGAVGGVEAEVDGAICDFAHPVIAVQARTTGASAAEVARLLPGADALPFTVAGEVEGWTQITGQAGDLRVTGQVAGATVRGDLFGEFRDIRTDFSLAGDALELSNLSASAYDGRVAGHAWVSLDREAETTALFTGEVDSMDVARLVAQFVPASSPDAPAYGPHHLHGTLSGPVALTLGGDGGISLIAQPAGKVGMADLLAADMRADMRIDADAEGAYLRIARLQARAPEGEVHARGEVRRDGALDFALDGSGLDLSALAARGHLPLASGRGYFTGTLTGTPAQARVVGRVQAQGGRFNGVAFSDATADVDASLGETPRVTLANIRVIAGDSQLLASARLTADLTRAQPTWDAAGEASLPRVTLQSLGASLGMDLPLDGIVEGRLVLAGVPDDITGQGSLIIRHPVVRFGDVALELDRISVENATLQGQTLHITNAQVTYPGLATPITVSGRISLDPQTPPEQQLSLQVRAPALDLDKFSTLANGANGAHLLLTKDARLWLPFDTAATFALNATVTGQLTPALGATVADTLAHTLVVTAAVDAGESLVVAGIPYPRCAATVEYRGRDQKLTVSRFELARRDDRGTYGVALTEPSTISLPIHHSDVQLDLHLALHSDHLDQITQDLLAMSAFTEGHPWLAPLVAAVQSIPGPYDGNAKVRLDVRGTPQHPLVESDFTLTTLTVAGNPVADVEGAVSYDALPRALTIERLTTSGGPAPDATASLGGTLTLPEKDARGREITPGVLNLQLIAQDLNPAIFAPWLPHLPLADIQGAATVIVDIDSTTANPRVRASVDMANPSLFGVEFGLLAAIVTLEDNQLILGRKVRREDGSITRIPTILAFKDIEGGASTPLQLYGELPLRWKGTLTPELPAGEKIFFTAELPKQGLDVVRAYLPGFPRGDGALEGALEVHGTLGESRFEVISTSGRFFAQAPELLLETTDADLPDRLRDVVVDIGIHREEGAALRNLIAVNNISLTYDREQAPVKRYPRVIRWARSLLGRKTKEPFVPGTITVKGTIDPQPVLSAQQPIPLNRIPDRLGYDLYAEMRDLTLVQKQDFFAGRVAGFLHLGNYVNREDGAVRPLLSGVLYVEDGRLALTAKDKQVRAAERAQAAAPRLAFTPDLSLALQFGKGNVFTGDLGDTMLENVLSSMLSAEIVFSPTSISGGDGTPLARWPIDPYHYTAETLKGDAYTGTRAWVTGSLAQPVIAGGYVLQPRKSEIQLPGGVLTVLTGSGEVDIRPADPDPLRRMTVKAEATGLLNDYRIAAHVEGDLARVGKEGVIRDPLDPDALAGATGALPVRFEMVSAPRGAPALSHNDISKRLFGVTDLLAALDGSNGQAWSPIIQHMGNNLLLKGPLKALAGRLGLETITVNATPDLYEASLATPEFGISRWGSFRMGATHTFTDPPEWDAWLDYRLPAYKRLRNLSINTTINSNDENSVSLQYKVEF